MSDMTHKMWSQWKDYRLNESEKDFLQELVEVLEADLDGSYVPGSLKGKGVNNFPMLKYSSPEAKQFVEKDIKQMGKFFNKASQQTIKTMMDGVKSGKYDGMDLIRGIKTGPAGDTSVGVRDMLGVLWTKVDKRFRSYLGGKKRR